MNTAKSMHKQAFEGITQFELTKFLINNLQQFNITPTAKLVLLYLSTCYNPNNAEVFPKQKTISACLGISEVSVTRAIAELHKEGLIISERKLSNRYIFTNNILKFGKYQKERIENIKLIDSYKEQKKEQKKEQTVSSDNISISDFAKLKDYAASKGATNVTAYAKALVKNCSYREILGSLQQAEKAKINAQKRIEETKKLIESFKNSNSPEIPESVKMRAFEIKNRLRNRHCTN